MTVKRFYTDMRSAGEGPSLSVFLSFGFRPFFLGASIYGAACIALWLVWIGIHAAGGALTWLTISMAPHVWHAHEMVYGFAFAGVAGFLLTAVPNWTGTRPVAGYPLALLFVVWVAGRIAVGLSILLPTLVVAIADLAFLPALTFYVAVQLFNKPQPRNLIFLLLLATAFAGNSVFHFAQLKIASLDPLLGVRIGLFVLTILIVIIGGRVTPAFTANYLKASDHQGLLPFRDLRLDAAGIIAMVLFCTAVVFDADDAVVGTLALVAAIANGVRLAGWRGMDVMSVPIVFVLHVGFAWVVIGLTLWALNMFTGWLSVSEVEHAFGVGAVATMIVAIMSRASLGHTGRALIAPRPIVASYALISVAALVRIVGPIAFPEAQLELHMLAGVLLFAALTTFAVVYLPILIAPRARPVG